jgi:hypothetical protein
MSDYRKDKGLRKVKNLVFPIADYLADDTGFYVELWFHHYPPLIFAVHGV